MAVYLTRFAREAGGRVLLTTSNVDKYNDSETIYSRTQHAGNIRQTQQQSECVSLSTAQFAVNNRQT